MLRSVVELGSVVVLWGVGLAALYGLLLLYETVAPSLRGAHWKQEEDHMRREGEVEILPAEAGWETAVPGALEVARQVGSGQGGGLLESVAAVFAARHAAGVEEHMPAQVERKLAVRQRLAEGVGKTVDTEDGAKKSLHRSQMNDICRQRELQAALHPPVSPPPAQPARLPRCRSRRCRVAPPCQRGVHHSLPVPGSRSGLGAVPPRTSRQQRLSRPCVPRTRRAGAGPA